jgi:hypothetical protein
MSCEKISIRTYAHTLTCRWTTPKKTQKNCEGNIGHHLKKKKKRTPKVFQRLYVFHLYAQRNHSLKQVWEVGTFHKEEWKNVANVFNCKLPTSSKFEKDSTDNNLLSKKIKRHHIFSFPATPRLLGTPTFRTEKDHHNPNELVLIPQYATRSNQRNIVSESWRTSEICILPLPESGHDRKELPSPHHVIQVGTIASINPQALRRLFVCLYVYFLKCFTFRHWL